MFAHLIGDIAVVSAATVMGLMIVSLIVAGVIGWHIAKRRIDIFEIEGTPTPLPAIPADSPQGAGGLCFCRNVILVE